MIRTQPYKATGPDGKAVVDSDESGDNWAITFYPSASAGPVLRGGFRTFEEALREARLMSGVAQVI